MAISFKTLTCIRVRNQSRMVFLRQGINESPINRTTRRTLIILFATVPFINWQISKLNAAMH